MGQGVNVNQRNRTRRALMEGALTVMREGAIPSVSDAAEAAGVSRATAYRYFGDSSSLVAAVLDDTVRPIRFEETAGDLPADPAARIDRFLDEALPILQEHAPQLRVALRLALEQGSDGSHAEVPGVGRGTRFGYVRAVLAPLREQVDDHALERAVAALALVVGIEAQIVLRDLSQLDDDGVEDVVRWTCRLIVDALTQPERGQRA